MAEQGQQTLEEVGIDFSQVIQANPEWWDHVSRLRYSGQNLKGAFELGVQAHNAEDPQEVFEAFVERIVGIKRANKNKRQAAKARKK